MQKTKLNFSFFIAKRYLLSKKTANVINIISSIAIVGIMFGTMAFIIVLSVFNGFEKIINQSFSSFDPDLKIESNSGNTFPIDTSVIQEITKLPEVAFASFTLEKNVICEYKQNHIFATLKAVDDNYKNVTGIDTMISSGDFILYSKSRPQAIVGVGIASKLGINVYSFSPLIIWAPKTKSKAGSNLISQLNSDIIHPGGIFSAIEEYNNKYIIVPLKFASELMNYKNQATSLEIKLVKSADIEKTKQKIQKITGKGFSVLNRYEQKKDIYKMIKTEKWAIIAILSFILIVSSFNIVGSMIMLILEKKQDIGTLFALGTDLPQLRKIFMSEGVFISAIGSITGLLLGIIIVLIQQYFGIITFPSAGSFYDNVYPVELHFSDIILVFVIVMLIGSFISRLPVRFITKKFFMQN